MEEFVAKYRPFRERTVRKDKVGAWPTAVYTKQQDSTEVDLLVGLRNDFNSGDQPVGLSNHKGPVQGASEGGNVTDVIFVDDCIVEVAVAEVQHMQTNMTRTQETTFLTERMKVSP